MEVKSEKAEVRRSLRDSPDGIPCGTSEQKAEAIEVRVKSNDVFIVKTRSPVNKRGVSYVPKLGNE